MSNRPASWRMPTREEMEKMATSAVGRDGPRTHTPSPADDMPPEYWQSVLDEAAAEGRPAGRSMQTLQLSEIPRHILRVSCRRCSRTVEIQKADAVRWPVPKRSGRRSDSACWTTPANNGPV